MMSIKERKYFYSLIVANTLLIILFLISIVSCISDIFDNKSLNDNFFEIIYAAYHFIVLAFALILEIKALRDGSFIIKGLTTISDGKHKNKIAMIISLIISIIGLVLTVIFTLISVNVIARPFNFPDILIQLLIHVPLFLLVYGLYFFFYPMIAIKKER